MRLRYVRLIRVFALERLPEALQFKNKRSALGPDSVAVRLADPARRDPPAGWRTRSRGGLFALHRADQVNKPGEVLDPGAGLVPVQADRVPPQAAQNSNPRSAWRSGR